MRITAKAQFNALTMRPLRVVIVRDGEAVIRTEPKVGYYVQTADDDGTIHLHPVTDKVLAPMQALRS